VEIPNTDDASSRTRAFDYQSARIKNAKINNFRDILRLFDPHFHTGNERMAPLNANRPHM